MPLSLLSGPAVDPQLPFRLPPRLPKNPVPAEEFLVAHHGSDTRELMSACTVCARGKSSRPSFGELRPWSHIALDFVTGLPPSQGNNTILTIVDRLSKSVHFVALPKLPTARETADLLVQHVFHLHGNPLDIVSDRGPQFISKVWSEFCQSPLHSILRLMDKLTGQTKTWSQPYNVLLPKTPILGALTWPGSNTPITPSSVRPQACHRSRPLWTTNPPCFRLRKETSQCRWSNTTSAAVARSGGTLGPPSSGLQRTTAAWQTNIGSWILNRSKVVCPICTKAFPKNEISLCGEREALPDRGIVQWHRKKAASPTSTLKVV
ncbi:uncharacterized protein LOC123981380 isoform X2 [Micropterus dolomieu]|uniref:uncharacterized protein LOC123981380 isoform X2 n=1 Tax=Micropterus dolomieu TaxID=147949 RepID=UPI001E8EF47F|nr:uncharacterized protein LOC123981380 isoform X2 [Micropterus dolomieu]